MSEEDQNNAYIQMVINEAVEQIIELTRLRDHYSTLFNYLDAFKSFVLKDAALSVLAAKDKRTHKIQDVTVTDYELSFRFSPPEVNDIMQGLFTDDLVFITEHVFGRVADALQRRHRFALIKSCNARSRKCSLHLLDSHPHLEMFEDEITQVLRKTKTFTVLTSMVPFGRTFSSLSFQNLHDKSPLLELLLEHEHKAVFRPMDTMAIHLLNEDSNYRDMNAEQQQTANHVIGAMTQPADLTLIQGPPGTGKTHLLCVMLHTAMQQSECCTVVCAPSNAAISRSCNKFLEMYKDVNRDLIAILGRDDKMIQGKMLSSDSRKCYYGHKENAKWKLVKRKARIVFCTVSCTMSIRMKGVVYQQVFCDEAGQLNEADALMLVRNQVKQLVMLGDPKQLPALSLIENAKELNANRSMMERMWDLGHACKIMLKVQYRMAPLIRAIVSQLSYDNQLRDGENVKHHTFDFDYPYEVLQWINVRGLEQSVGTSWCNEQEAQQVFLLVKEIVNKSKQSQKKPSIGIITAYLPQRDRLRLLLSGYKDEEIQIDTVDAFQGQEKDIIILSLVRSKRTIGFLSDKQRTTVAISRARMSLIIVGKRALFSKHEPWKLIINHVDDWTFLKSYLRRIEDILKEHQEEMLLTRLAECEFTYNGKTKKIREWVKRFGNFLRGFVQFKVTQHHISLAQH